MGIYSDGSIYGVCLIVNGVYKRVYEERMNRDQYALCSLFPQLIDKQFHS